MVLYSSVQPSCGNTPPSSIANVHSNTTHYYALLCKIHGILEHTTILVCIMYGILLYTIMLLGKYPWDSIIHYHPHVHPPPAQTQATSPLSIVHRDTQCDAVRGRSRGDANRNRCTCHSVVCPRRTAQYGRGAPTCDSGYFPCAEPLKRLAARLVQHLVVSESRLAAVDSWTGTGCATARSAYTHSLRGPLSRRCGRTWNGRGAMQDVHMSVRGRSCVLNILRKCKCIHAPPNLPLWVLGTWRPVV